MGRIWSRGWLIFLGAIVLTGTPAWAEQVSGDACYTYVDTESLDGARYTTVALAKRRAIESYVPFQEATVNLRDPVLLREIMTNLLVRGIDRVKIVDEREDLAKKEVCRNVQAQVDPGRMKSLVRAVEKSYRFRNGGQDTGLPGNGKIQVVSAQESYCREGGRKRCLYLAVQCQRNTFNERSLVRVTWFDQEGRPSFTAKKRVLCENQGDVATFWLRMPEQGLIFSLDVPTN